MEQEYSITEEINHYLDILFPITRSLTGKGNRETLRVIQEIIPLKIKEVPSGTKVYDWIVPDEWNIKGAWIKDRSGSTLVDMANCNLHVVSYSEPVKMIMDWDQLRPKLNWIDELPDAVPYRTSYYKRDWGFCVTKDQYDAIREAGTVEVFIDSEFSQGSLSYGEILIPGKSEKEILISCYICHPSMANDSLSGVILTAFIARSLMSDQPELMHSYRIIFVPETIGAITYCATHEEQIKELVAGLVITTVGGPGKYGYKQSFEKNHDINGIIESVLNEMDIDFITYPFDVYGSDERQYSSQGFRVNVASITRDKYYEYDYYHTSLDNLDYVKAKNISESYDIYRRIIARLDRNLTYDTVQKYCEPMFGKRNLYPSLGGGLLPPEEEMDDLDCMLWLNYFCDGTHSLFGISEAIGATVEQLHRIARILESRGLLKLLL